MTEYHVYDILEVIVIDSRNVYDYCLHSDRSYKCALTIRS